MVEVEVGGGATRTPARTTKGEAGALARTAVDKILDGVIRAVVEAVEAVEVEVDGNLDLLLWCLICCIQ